MFEKSIFQTKAVSYEDLARAFDREFQKLPTGSAIPANLIRDILKANPQMASTVLGGRGEFVPQKYDMWMDGPNIIEQADWIVREPVRTTKDPTIRVIQLEPSDTKYKVQEILERQLQIQFTTYSLSRGPISREAAQCIEDLAIIKQRSPEQLYNQYLDTFMSCWVDAIASPKTVRPKYARDSVYEIPAGVV